MFKPVYLFLVILFWTIACQPCPQGQTITTTKNTCSPIQYIQGCHQYLKQGQCSACQFNYDLTNGFCNYNQRKASQCCKAFSSDGSCKECEIGLFLEDGACKQIKIAGCLWKNGKTCGNCAQGFYLGRDGRCGKGVKGCGRYDTNNGNCLECQQGYTLTTGLCTPTVILGCKTPQTPTSCNSCHPPFTLSTLSTCSIPSCKSYNQFGCIQCQTGFYLTPNFTCSEMFAGCEIAQRGVCYLCASAWTLSQGRCRLDGCNKEDGRKMCTGCEAPARLQNGNCVVENCLRQKNGRCEVCQGNYNLQKGSCVKSFYVVINSTADICTACQQGYTWTENNKCSKIMIGCSKYENGKCKTCQTGLEMEENNKCWIDGCENLTSSGCMVCMKPYKLENRKCRLENCGRSRKGRCVGCNEGYVSREGVCVVRDGNCQNYNDQGVCTGCRNGRLFGSECITNMITGCVTYSSSDRNRCQNCNSNFILNDGRCIVEDCDSLDNNGCVTCRNPFKLVRGKCRLDNCRQSGNGICQVCQDGWVRKNGFCTVVRDGNCQNYNDQGVCTGCRNGRLFGSECITNMITGCVTYSSSDRNRCQNCNSNFILNDGRCIVEDCDSLDNNGCVTCRNPFKLVRGKCRLDNCRQSGNGICQVCQDGWVRKNGFCTVVRDGNCQNYNDQGVCTGCRNGRLFGSECITNMITGCVTYSSSDRNRCQNCNSNFILNDGRCIVEDCDSLDNNGCVTCRNPFKLVRGKCRLDNCRQSGNGICQVCQDGWVRKNGFCTVVRDGNCQNYNDQGVCTGCRNGRLFGSECITNMITGCVTYSSSDRNRCQNCNSNFILNDGRCIVEDCDSLDNNGCVTCRNPFKLVRGKCRLDNCRQSGNGICQVCQDGWVRKNGFCTVVRDGNCQNYNDQGVCTGCRNGRLFGSECITNMITGCVTYSSSDRNRCQFCNPNTLLSPQGQCRPKDPNCLNFNFQGTCTSCRPNWRLFNSQCISIIIIGCNNYSPFDRMRCQTCSPNFVLTPDGRCTVENCINFDNSGCMTCNPQFQLVSGRCQIRMSQPVPQNNNGGGGCNPGGGHHGGRNGGRNGGCSPPPSYNPCVPQYQPYRPAFSPCQPPPCFRRC